MLASIAQRTAAVLEWLDVHPPNGIVFCSFAFTFLFTALLCLYWALPWNRARVWLLILASFAFYATWSEQLAFIVLVSATLDFLLARGIEGQPSPVRRRLLVTVSVVANLGLLCYFKYVNFFLGPLDELLHTVGADSWHRWLPVIVPVGISFYTFEAINYVVDVYRGKVRAERKLSNFLLFILFFPHLLAGPIVRARDFLPQIDRRKRWDWMRVQLGVRFILMGLFKKMVIADRMAYFVKPVFDQPDAYHTGAVWLAVIAFALQIYGDFSGYTDMAIGTAHLLGFRLAQNFNLPYLAANVSDFWRRWHISLSSWLRDYLFIPLGGSRLGRWRTCLNLMIVMTLGGLWHGANWTFVAWGVLHGLYLVVHKLFADACSTRPRVQWLLQTWPGTAARVALTLSCVTAGWVFFRAQTFEGAALFFRGLVVANPLGRSEPMAAWGVGVVVAVVVLCHALGRNNLWLRIADRLPAPVVGMAYALILTMCLVLAPPTGQPFIYFQF
jgi:alginate O-acetyltransferase complex protein AlgI